MLIHFVFQPESIKHEPEIGKEWTQTSLFVSIGPFLEHLRNVNPNVADSVNQTEGSSSGRLPFDSFSPRLPRRILLRSSWHKLLQPCNRLGLVGKWKHRFIVRMQKAVEITSSSIATIQLPFIFMQQYFYLLFVYTARVYFSTKKNVMKSRLINCHWKVWHHNWTLIGN